MNNIVTCVVPGIDLALSRQLWLALNDEHSLLNNRVYFFRSSPGEKLTRRQLLNLSSQTHRLRRAMFDAWQGTRNLRRN